MIRTVIEVDGRDDWEFGRNLAAALDKLGFEPKPSPDTERFRSDMYRALHEKGIDIPNLVDEYRAKIAAQLVNPATT